MVASFGEKKLNRKLEERRKRPAQAARSTSRVDTRLATGVFRAVGTEPEPLAGCAALQTGIRQEGQSPAVRNCGQRLRS